MGFFLLDNPNPYGPHFYTQRRTCQHGIPASKLPHLICVHTAESEPDIHGADTGAEGVANYAATTPRSVSWHETIDSDSSITMLPDNYVAFHVRGYNTCAVGCEIATRAHQWADLPDEWKRAVYANVAAWIDRQCATHGIPKVLLTRSQADAGAYGVIGHTSLDPTRRSDPGPDFDWQTVLAAKEDPVAAPILVKKVNADGSEAPEIWQIVGRCRSHVSAAVWRHLIVDEQGQPIPLEVRSKWVHKLPYTHEVWDYPVLEDTQHDHTAKVTATVKLT